MYKKIIFLLLISIFSNLISFETYGSDVAKREWSQIDSLESWCQDVRIAGALKSIKPAEKLDLLEKTKTQIAEDGAGLWGCISDLISAELREIETTSTSGAAKKRALEGELSSGQIGNESFSDLLSAVEMRLEIGILREYMLSTIDMLSNPSIPEAHKKSQLARCLEKAKETRLQLEEWEKLETKQRMPAAQRWLNSHLRKILSESGYLATK